MKLDRTILKAGTRGSALARIQTRTALDRLESLFPSFAFQDVPLSTPGDRDQETDLRQSPPDFFTRDLDDQVRQGVLDCAVHSAKDVPDPIGESLDWVWLPWREDPRDVLVMASGRSLSEMPEKGTIGVSSGRREDYCRARFPHARQAPIRGTIENRLSQLDRGAYDLLIMAGAALIRLGLTDRITEWIPIADLPSPDGQGSLALTFRSGDRRFQVIRRLFVKAVTFAGAGVGSAGSCTLDSLHALQRCDVCLHDTLLGHDLLDQLPSTVRRIDVGKRCGQHSVSQEETTGLITRFARQGLNVVRLKGGDPGLFGRLAEEVEALDALALPYRVLPGVSSLTAATSTTGMLLTRRGVSRGFAVMSPRTEGGGTGSISAEARQKLPIVLFMAMSVMDEVSRQLIGEGFAPETPTAAVFGAGSDQALTITGTLANMAARIREAHCEMPGLLIIGDPANHRYAHHGALEGRRVLLTSSKTLQEKAADQVRDYGGIPVCRPLIELETTTGALEAVRRIAQFDWVVLTSPSSVRSFGELLRNAGVDLRSVPKIATCGGGTSRELKALGLAADLEPASDFSADSLLETFTPLVKPGLRILRLRSDKAGPDVASALRALGALVEECELFRNRPVRYDEKPEFEAAFFASASAVEAYDALWGAASLKGVCVVALGKPTVAALHKIGIKTTLVSPEATVESALTALAIHFAQLALSIQRYIPC